MPGNKSKMMEQRNAGEAYIRGYDLLLDCDFDDQLALRSRELAAVFGFLSKFEHCADFFKGAAINLNSGDGFWMNRVLSKFEHQDAWDLCRGQIEARNFYKQPLDQVKLKDKYSLVLATHSFGR